MGVAGIGEEGEGWYGECEALGWYGKREVFLWGCWMGRSILMDQTTPLLRESLRNTRPSYYYLQPVLRASPSNLQPHKMSILKLSKKLSLLSSLRNPRYTPKPFPPPHQNLHSGPTSQFGASLSPSNKNGLSSKSLISPRNYGVVASNVLEDEKSKKMLWRLVGLVFGMLGLTYASVPFYRIFCESYGIGGTVKRGEAIEEKIVRHAEQGTAPTREIVVQFNADVDDGMQWKFIPTQREVRVKTGECALAFYTAENRSSSPITGVSTYNVTPQKAGKYFNKIQCFCFEKQCLLPGEQIDMPVFFYIDPEIETDRTLQDVHNMILSYTFFKTPEQ